MELEQQIQADFDRAVRRAFWRSVRRWFTGQSNELLPFDEIQSLLPTHAQRYRGIQQVPLQQIGGSVGRYRDFDRAFLPRQRTTRHRWMSINRAHYQDVSLPPIELYKIGEVYFVKDGNHRVSVARQQDQEWIDALVIEIDCPVPFTSDTDLDQLIRNQEALLFLAHTRLLEVRPDAQVELTLPGQYEKLFEHIQAHQWYLGIEQHREVPFHEAVASWYDHVYLPLVHITREQGILAEFPGRTEADLYLWLIEHQWYLQQNQDAEAGLPLDVIASAYAETFGERPWRRLVRLIREAARWVGAESASPSPSLDHPSLPASEPDEATVFYTQTDLRSLRPEAQLTLTQPAHYAILLEHIRAHQWYLGIEQQREIPFSEAVTSWYDHVYLPLATMIRECQGACKFPSHTEADLYLLISQHEWYLQAHSADEAQRSLSSVVAAYIERFHERPWGRLSKTLAEMARRMAQELATVPITHLVI